MTAGGDCVQCLWAGNGIEFMHVDLAEADAACYRAKAARRVRL